MGGCGGETWNLSTKIVSIDNLVKIYLERSCLKEIYETRK